MKKKGRRKSRRCQVRKRHSLHVFHDIHEINSKKWGEWEGGGLDVCLATEPEIIMKVYSRSRCYITLLNGSEANFSTPHYVVGGRNKLYYINIRNKRNKCSPPSSEAVGAVFCLFLLCVQRGFNFPLSDLSVA